MKPSRTLLALLAPLAWASPAIGMLLWPPMFYLFDMLRLKAWRHR